MGYRKLTPEEYNKAQGDLNTLISYNSLIAVALQLYGAQAHKVEVELDGQYNDEGGTQYNVTSISVTNREGKDAKFDLTTPFWVETLAKDKEYAEKYADYEAFDLIDYNAEDEQWQLEEHFSDDLSDLRYNIHVTSYDDFDFECIVGMPPELKYQELYVLED